MSLLKWKKKEVSELLVYLQEQGYIEASDIGEAYWQISMRGRVLAHSIVAREFKVDTLNQHLDALVERAKEINSAARFPDYIICLKIIGPYPINCRGTGIRIAYATARKNITEEAYDIAADQLRAAHTGTFGNLTQYYTYPLKAIERYLKSGSKVLKLHTYTAEEINMLEGHIVIPENRDQ